MLIIPIKVMPWFIYIQKTPVSYTHTKNSLDISQLVCALHAKKVRTCTP